MINLGFIWGFGLGLLLLLAVVIFIKKKIKKEVKVINVERPKDEGTEVESRANANPTIDTGEGHSDSRVEERVDGEEPDGEPEERGGVQNEPIEAVEHIESGNKQYSSTTPPPEPFRY